jgi:hypothetical protein
MIRLHVINVFFLQTIENSTSEIDMNRINNLVFDPFKCLMR